MKTYLIYIALFFSLVPAACDDREEYSHSTAHTLHFSHEVLSMDTVLTGLPTSTRQLMVYNPHPKPLLVSSISLAGAEQSGFRINVDGTPGTTFADVEIASGDSLHIFVEATFGSHGDAAVHESRDSILFLLNGQRQEVKLRAYSRDAVMLRGCTLLHDTLIADERPLLIYDSLVVAQGVRLTLGAGTHLYFHAQAGMRIEGQLLAEGTLEHPVVLRGDRTDRLFPHLPYDRLPGQWGGLHFTSESYDNRLTHVDIHGGSFGIRCDSSDVAKQKLTLSHSSIRQVSGNALQLHHSRSTATNTELANAGGHTVWLVGGSHHFLHCTVANYYSWGIRQGVALCLDNPAGSAEVLFTNCLIAGSAGNELLGVDETTHFLHTRFVKGDDFRLTDPDNQLYDFHPTETSEAIDAADAASAQACPTDRDGYPRLEDAAPDLGCYEYRLMP